MSVFDEQEQAYLEALSRWVDQLGDPYRPPHLFDPVEHAKLVEKGIWRSADGREMPIVEMTDQHLVNALRFIKRHAVESLEMELSVMRVDARLGGTRGYAAAERAYLTFIERGPNHIVSNTTSGSRLLREWKRRGYHPDGWHINFCAKVNFKKKPLHQNDPAFNDVVWHHDPAASGPRERAFLTYGPARFAVVYVREVSDHAEWWIEFAGGNVTRGAAPDLQIAKLAAFRMWEHRR